MLIVLLVLGCAGNDETTPAEPAACALGEWLGQDGACVAAGLPPDMPCPPAEWLRDGVCIPAGVPPDGCGEGFVHDGDRGCEPVLPSEPCGPGLMAIPGDAACREVAPCDTGTWGAIPVESNTEYVDASYAGMDSDGSALKPWTTVQAAVDAASAGAIVAIAQGSYLEDVLVSGKPARLWGVCPALVTLGTVRLLDSAGSEVRGVAIEGAGLVVSGSLDVLIERVWVHDNAGRGVTLSPEPGPTRATLRDSLVEGCQGGGVFVNGSDATIESSAVRNIQSGTGLNGRGVGLENYFATPAKLVMRSSLIEESREMGLFVGAAEADVEASVIRRTQPAEGQFGRGVSVQERPYDPPAKLVMRTSLVEDNHDTGVIVASAEATIETSVIRNTQPDADLERGEYGVSALRYPESEVPATLVLHSSLVEANPASGVYVAGADATVEASVIRDNESHTDLLLNGRGIHAQIDPWMGAPSTLVVRSSLVERNHDVGIVVAGSAATVETSIVRDTLPDAHGFTGRGIQVQAAYPAPSPPATILVRASLIERNHEAGIEILGAVADIDGCVVRDSYPSPALEAGHGITVISNPDYGAATATVGATRIHQNALAAISSWGAHVAVGRSALSCNAFDLNAETNFGSAAEFDDLGENVCGCPEPIGSCKSVSAGLQAPPPL